MNSTNLLCMIAALSVTPSAFADGFVFDSGEHRVALLELYTSEGCNSCPPAEAWLANLRNDPALWHKFVPISFHVDYWDHLGWRDRFASKESTQRQYVYAETLRSSSVYTPCFILDGKEWHPARGQEPETDEFTAGRLCVEWNGKDRIKVRFTPVTRGTSFEAYVALLGGGLFSKVTAGENSGVSLSHEFVVLSLVRTALVNADGLLQTVEQEWKAIPPGEAERLAVAIWVTRTGDIRPVQATGGWIR